MTQSEPRFPSNHAFVVQFWANKRDAHVPPTGRVEHVISGQAPHFQSWEHLQRFGEKTLTEIQAEPL